MSDKDSHYVDNQKFLEAMSEWKEQIKVAEETGESKPPVSEYIGECFLLIAERLSMRANFINYPFREEMVGDAIENCLMYASNFDPAKSKNPFSYFTQIIYYAFLRRIQKEKKQMYIRFKSSQVMVASGGTYSGDEVNLNLNTNVDYMNSFVQDYEDKIAKDKAKKKESIEAAAKEEDSKE